MDFDTAQIKRIVVKAGTNVLTGADGRLDEAVMEELASEIAALRSQGKEVIFVTSGAIASGIAQLRLTSRPREAAMQQACAAVGQPALMHVYAKLFQKRGIEIAQVLLTNDDFTIRERYLGVMDVLEELLRAKVVPVINENDVVSHRPTDRNRRQSVFDDNDQLSALVASKMRSDLLVILTDVDGLYDCNPKKSKDAHLIRGVGAITAEIEESADGTCNIGRGGMKTKLAGAKLATSSGVWVVMANGKKPGVLPAVLAHQEGTLFFPAAGRLSGKEQWIAFASSTSGAIGVNQKARDALVNKGASLLAVGVVSARGDFKRGDVVAILHGEEIVARGKVNYSAKEMLSIAGKRSAQIREVLGRSDEVVDRENLVITKKGENDG